MAAPVFDKSGRGGIRRTMRAEGSEQRAAGTRRAAMPAPLLVGFVLFIVAMGYIVATSLTRRTAPAFAPTAEARVRPPGWERTGDTITVDATDGDRWRYVSLERGRVLSPPDTAGWDLAVRRYHLRPNGGAVDLGLAAFDTARGGSTSPSDTGAMERWYRYSLVT